MIRAAYSDKKLVAAMLAKSFNNNKSVNYIVKQDAKRVHRLRNLMEYSFEICYLFGDVFFTADKKGCALVILPDKKKTTIKSILLDLKLVFSCVGLFNLTRVMRREGEIKKLQPKEPLYYLWFIGVDQQNNIRVLEAPCFRMLSKKACLCKEPFVWKRLH